MSLSDLEKRAILKPVEAELDRQKEKAAQFKKAYHELLDAVKASHETGLWGPVEDAYAASGRPCLPHRDADTLAKEVEKLQLEIMDRDCRPDYERGERAGEDAMMRHIATLEEKNNSALARAIRNCAPFAVRANILSQVATWLETASYKTGEAFDPEAAKACKRELDTIQARAEKYQGPQPDDL